MADQFRADCLGAVNPAIHTPNLDRLCRAGVTFRNHVTTTVPCGPARASLHTGLYLMNHRQVQNWVPLDARHTTLPRALRGLGVDPALIGGVVARIGSTVYDGSVRGQLLTLGRRLSTAP